MIAPPPPSLRIAPPPPLRVAPPPPVTQKAPPPPATTKKHKTLDIETYRNYFLIMFRDFNYKTGVEEGSPESIELYGMQYYVNRQPVNQSDAIAAVHKQLQACTVVTFNGIKYDNLVLTGFCAGFSVGQLKQLNDLIIPGKQVDKPKQPLMPWTFERKFGLRLLKYDHIDLIEVAFGTASLKVYGARLKCPLLQELPIPHWMYIMPIERDVIYDYCVNDNFVTVQLFQECKPAIVLREKLSKEYSRDFRSKSDAQIGEAILSIESERMNRTPLNKTNVKTMKREFYYEPPAFLNFKSDTMNEVFSTVLSTEFQVSQSTNKVTLPKAIGKVIKLGKGDNQVSYKMGIGGLHSVTSGGTFYSTDEYEIFEIDVSSYYPNIILQCGFFVPGIGKPQFAEIYSRIIDKKNNASARLKVVNKELEALKAML